MVRAIPVEKMWESCTEKYFTCYSPKINRKKWLLMCFSYGCLAYEVGGLIFLIRMSIVFFVVSEASYSSAIFSTP